jgi:hypothetical protein
MGAAIALMLVCSAHVPAEDALTPAQIEARHAASLARIKTLRCRYRRIEKISGREEAGEYWRAGRNLKVTESFPHFPGGLAQTGVVFEGVYTSYGVRDQVRPGEDRTSATIDSADTDTPNMDVYRHCLAAFQGRGGVHALLGDWLSAYTQNAQANRADANHWVIKAEIPDPHIKAFRGTIKFDIRRNFLANEVIYEGGEGLLAAPVRRESRVVKFAEPEPGVYFPSVVTTESFREGKKVVDAEYSLSELRINEPIDPAEFVIMFAPGTKVFDRIRNVLYTVGADGKSVADEQPYNPKKVVPLWGEMTSPAGQSQNGANWLLIAAGVLAALAVGWVLVRRWRGSAAA